MLLFHLAALPLSNIISLVQGINDVARLGTVERYFVEIMDIPRLKQRIQCFIFCRTFAGTKAKVDGLIQCVICALGKLLHTTNRNHR